MNILRDVFQNYKFSKSIILRILFSCIILSTNPSIARYYSPYGGPFTPKGDIRILVIYAGFEEDCDNSTTSVWPNVNSQQGLPPCKTFPSYFKELFYSEYSQFNPNAQDKTISNFYYQMSRHHPSNPPLRIVADAFPEKINISGNSPDNFAVFKKIQENYPDFDWSKYDNRKNNPNFEFDNSMTEPDFELDYVIVIWRKYGARGYASTNSFTFTSNKNSNQKYKINPSCGFTITNGNPDNFYYMTDLFHHEFAHTLFNCPHLFFANSVTGDYLYASEGWGMMSYGYVNSSANAWESWYCGWIEIPEVNDLKDYTQNGTYKLRDFISTGDAMRIKLPFVNQHLWIENHAGINVLDNRHVFEYDGTPESVPPSDKGLMIFVENIADSRNKHISALSPAYANGLKVMHSNGNYDYRALDNKIDDHWYGNRVVNFEPFRANPTSAHNDIAFIRDNYSYDTIFPDKIIYRNFTNNAHEYTPICNGQYNTQPQEAKEIIKKNGDYTYDNLGIHAAFGNKQLPQKIGMSSNPVIVNHQKYICPDKLEPIYLNGISITILSKENDGSIVFSVAFDDTKITSKQRFTGDLILNDIPNSLYDIHITKGNSLTMDKSGSPNRIDQGELIDGIYEYPDFVNPSILTIDSNAVILIDDESLLNIKEGTTLRLKSGAKLIINGKLSVDKNSYLCIERGAQIQLKNKKQNLKLKGKMGVNPKLKLMPIKFIEDINSVIVN